MPDGSPDRPKSQSRQTHFVPILRRPLHVPTPRADAGNDNTSSSNKHVSRQPGGIHIDLGAPEPWARSPMRSPPRLPSRSVSTNLQPKRVSGLSSTKDTISRLTEPTVAAVDSMRDRMGPQRILSHPKKNSGGMANISPSHKPKRGRPPGKGAATDILPLPDDASSTSPAVGRKRGRPRRKEVVPIPAARRLWVPLAPANASMNPVSVKMPVPVSLPEPPSDNEVDIPALNSLEIKSSRGNEFVKNSTERQALTTNLVDDIWHSHWMWFREMRGQE